MRKFGNGTTEETLYDKAGRVSVKLQKDGPGQLLWGEGYVYGSDGKRTATVDNTGSYEPVYKICGFDTSGTFCLTTQPPEIF